MLLRAVDAYVAVAYADTHVPLSVKARTSFDPRMGFKSLISHEVFDRTHVADRPDVLDECRLRLGNAKYPHMKLILKPRARPGHSRSRWHPRRRARE